MDKTIKMKDKITIEEITEGIKEWLKAGNKKRQCFCLMVDKETKVFYQMMQGRYCPLVVMLASAAINDANINRVINEACLLVKTYKDEKEPK